MKLTGHTVLITGAGTGLGSGLAAALHAKGNQVIITGRREEVLKSFAAKHPGMLTYTMDVAKEADVKQLFDWVSQNHPRLDFLVNNAGIMQWPDFAKPETLDGRLFDEIEINVKGLIRMTATFLPLLSRQPEAALINVSSGLAYMPLSMSPIYCATKAAVHSFTMSLRHQLRHGSVKVIELAPPAVESDLGKAAGPPSMEFPKMKLDAFIIETLKALESGKTELPIGQSKMLKMMSRLAPGFAFGILNPSKG
jgi:uncharacterized oxidoreductase